MTYAPLPRPARPIVLRKALAHPRIALGVTALLGCGLSGLAFHLAQRSDRFDAEAEFVEVANVQLGVVRDKLVLHGELLRSITRLFASSREVEVQEFEEFLRDALRRHPSVCQVAWAPRVATSTCDALLADVHAVDRPAPSLSSVASPSLGSPNEGAASVPILYEVRLPGSASMLGTDLMSAPDYARAIEEVLRHDDVSMTPAVSEEMADGRRAVRMFMGVFDTFQVHAARPLGYATALIDLDGMLARAVDVVSPARRAGTNVHLLARGPGVADALIASSGTSNRHSLAVRSSVLPLPTVGTPWSVECTADAGFFESRQTGTPTLLLVLGLAATGLLVAHVRALAQSVRDAQAIGALLSHEVEVSRQAEEAQRVARGAAEQAAEDRTRFLTNVSHELRTPLHGVLGPIELTLLDELPPEQRERLNQSYRSGQSLLAIIDNLLVLTEISRGAVTLRQEALVAGDLGRSVVMALQPNARQRGVVLDLTTPAAPEPRLLGDAPRLRQVLFNLVDNAVKFTRSGTVRVDVGVTLAEAGGARLDFRVTDTGSGIEHEALGRIFEAFSQADTSLTREHGGLGVGLNVCRELVRVMGARLRVHSRPGEGSTFHVEATLPLASGEEHVERKPEPAAVARLDLAVLLVEDNAVNLRVLQAMLERLGCHVICASDGRQAVERLAQGLVVDVILMDCQMPVMDGYEATRRIRTMESPVCQTPILAVTAHAMSDDRDRCRAAGMDDYLAKPLGVGVLRAALERWGRARQSA